MPRSSTAAGGRVTVARNRLTATSLPGYRVRPQAAAEPTLELSALRLVAGRYLLLEPIAPGGTSRVFRGHDQLTGAAVAVKILLPSAVPGTAGDPDDVLPALAGLDHPGLICARDSGSVRCEGLELRYRVLEYVPGPSLDRRLQAGPLPLPETVALVHRLAGILAYLHGHGVVHRDVKPGNILLGPDGLPRLADLDAAVVQRGLDGVAAAGYVLGTPRYMAPEQVRGEPVTPAADLYALGLVMLECLTGRPEYVGSAIECALARLERPPLVPSWLPAGIRAVLRLLLAADPGARPTAKHLAQLLRPEPLPGTTAAEPVGASVTTPAGQGPARTPSWTAREPAGHAPTQGTGSPQPAIVEIPTLAQVIWRRWRRMDLRRTRWRRRDRGRR